MPVADDEMSTKSDADSPLLEDTCLLRHQHEHNEGEKVMRDHQKLCFAI